MKTVPFLRKRVQKSGNIFYYLELPEKQSRSEIPLGSCLESALAERRILLFKHLHLIEKFPAQQISILQWYEVIMVPLLAPRVASENRASIGRLILFFQQASVTDCSYDELESAYKKWRAQRLKIRAKKEFGLLKRILVWYQEMHSAHIDASHYP